jgi:PAS domain S-box-containing protein/putative nucleotidyltransferase with HDIG domain
LNHITEPSLSPRSTGIPIIKGIAYLIVSNTGKVFYASPQCEKLFHIHDKDTITWKQCGGREPGEITGCSSVDPDIFPILITTTFDLVWHGAQAKMLLLEANRSITSSPRVFKKAENGLQTSDLHPWVKFTCENNNTLSFVSLDDNIQKLTGYSKEILTGVQRNLRSLVSAIDQEMIFNIIHKSIQEKKNYSVVYRIQTATNEFKWVEEHGLLSISLESKPQITGWMIDITDRKKIEEALWESESRYRSLVEASPDAVLMLSHDGNLLLANRHFCNLIEVPDPDTILGKNILEFLHFEAPLPKNINFVDTWLSFPTKGAIYNLKNQSGNLIPVEVNLSIIRDNQNEISASIIVARDIRQRIQTEEALRQNEARYRAIVENNPEMIMRFDQQKVITFANQAFLNFVGMSFANIIGNKIGETPIQKEKRILNKIIEDIHPDMEAKEYEFSIHSPNQKDQWLRWRTSAITDGLGNFIEYQSLGIDITDQKKALQAEKETENRMAQLMENIKLLSVILDMNGKILSCNSYFCEITGWKKEEIVGVDWFSRFIPADIAGDLRIKLLEPARTGQLGTRNENLILTRDGERRLISWTNTVMKDLRGNPTAISSLGDDITEKAEMKIIQEAVLKISQAAIETNDLDDLYSSIHEILKTLVPVDNFFIAFYDKNRDLLSFPYFVDQFDPPPPTHHPGHGLTEYVLHTGKPISVNPSTFKKLVQSGKVISLGAPSLDWIGIPLRVEKEIVGVMGAQTYSPGIRYSKKDEQILTFVSTQIAMVIDRKRREQDLLTSQKRNQLLIEASTDAIFIESLDGTILDCNDIALAMYGYTHEEMLQQNVSNLVNPAFLDKKTNYTQWELDQGGEIHDVTNIRKDGSVFPVEVSMRQTNIDDTPVLVAYVRDITEKKKAAQEIIENEEKFRTLSETTAAGIFIYRGEQYLYVNPMWCQITGYTDKELMSMKPLDISDPDVDLNSVNHFEQDEKGNLTHARVEHTLTAKNGEKHIIDLNLTSLLFDGKPAYIGTAIDISNRKQREHELEIIAEMGEVLRFNVSREDVLDTAITKLFAIMKLDGALFSLYNSQKQIHKIEKAGGSWERLNGLEIPRENGLSGHILSSGLSYLNNEAEKDPYILYPEYVQEMHGLAGVPLMIKGGTTGSIIIATHDKFSENDLRLLKAVGDLTASAIHRADLLNQTVQQTDELRHAYDSTLEGWALALELRDKETQGHSVRITNMTLKLARRLGIPENQLEIIRRGALLHDIGKLGVPDTILLKNGPLTPEEWAIMQKHPEYAYNMLSQIKFFEGAIDIPYCHHEWWDGSGYPRGLEGENIPLAARIFSIIDVWDALTSNRPYREAWNKKEALAHIINQAGTHFDPDVVNEFIQMIIAEK